MVLAARCNLRCRSETSSCPVPPCAGMLLAPKRHLGTGRLTAAYGNLCYAS